MACFYSKRLVAAILPLACLWAFMACVAFCERESLESHSPADPSQSVALSDVRRAPVCEGCPLSYFPRATAPERAKFILALQATSITAVPDLSTIACDSGISGDSLDNPPYTSSPPLKLLSALRI